MLYLITIFEDIFFDNNGIALDAEVFNYFKLQNKTCFVKLQQTHIRQNIDHHVWLDQYQETIFFQLFRLKKETFSKLLKILLEKDTRQLIKKKYCGGNYPVHPEKALLVFLWYMSKQETLHSIADRFNLVPSTVMGLVNIFLYVLVHLKSKYIIWPQTDEEVEYIQNGFPSYPGVIGAIDGSHINIKVPVAQHDSYVDRFQSHSINLTAVCTANKVFTYVFVGFPGCAHDARVFAYSLLYRNIQRYGRSKYFYNDNCHIIGDSAFPLRPWLMVPFKGRNLTRRERYHNYRLSSARVNIENAFALLKGRWARLKFIHTYAVSKAIEISTAACVLHNFCLLNYDTWEHEPMEIPENQEECLEHDRRAYRMGEEKRNEITNNLQ